MRVIIKRLINRRVEEMSEGIQELRRARVIENDDDDAIYEIDALIDCYEYEIQDMRALRF